MSNCPCDQHVHPVPLEIPAGQARLERQIATYAEFRRAMLAAVRDHAPLDAWNVPDGDLGLMWVEMWAYVCDLVAFADETIAHECYVRTARLRPSLRRLIGLLGYLPRPAVAASAELAVLADGRHPVELPLGTAFRSGAFDDEPPQVFELAAPATVHPLANEWKVEPPRRDRFREKSAKLVDSRAPFQRVSNVKSLLLTQEAFNLDKDDLLLIRLRPGDPGTVRTVVEIADHDGADGLRYKRITLDTSIGVPAATLPSQIELLKPTEAVGLWTRQPEGVVEPSIEWPLFILDVYLKDRTLDSGRVAIPLETVNLNIGNPTFEPRALEFEPRETTFAHEEFHHLETELNTIGLLRGDLDKIRKISKTSLYLDAQYRQFRPGVRIIVSKDSEHRAFRVDLVREASRTTTPAQDPTIPAVTVPVTRITLDTDLNGRGDQSWTDADRSAITVHYALVRAGKATVEADTVLTPRSSFELRRPVETPRTPVELTRFQLEDKDETGVGLPGKINFPQATLDVTPYPSWTSDLVFPVRAYGNVVSATRGETVEEVLGSGDASLANQSFTLKKKPLTYVVTKSSAAAQGIASTLKIWVDSIRWREARGFFGSTEADRIYVVRHDDEGEIVVMFGDGVHGARLPSGRDNVRGVYRFGAGATRPPAGSIHQLARPVKGLKSVRNPVAAYGGDDAESVEHLAHNGPRSALMLDRAISVHDYEAVAAGYPGVRAARAEWAWSGERQRPVARIWFIGNLNLATGIAETLHNRTGPTASIEVLQARSRPASLSVSIEIDPRFVADDVRLDVETALMDRASGLLAPERVGIGHPLFRSRLIAAVQAVPGVTSIDTIQFQGRAFSRFAEHPRDGRYFDFEGRLTVTPSEGSDG